MKRAIPFVAILFLVCFVVCLNAKQGKGQQIPPEEIQVQPPIPESVAPTETPKAVPRIRYRDLINQLSDSLEGLKQDFAITSKRLDLILQENDSLKRKLDQAAEEAMQYENKRSERPSRGEGGDPVGFPFIPAILLGISLFVLAASVFLGRMSKISARQKEIEYKELLSEFENYRKSSRERFEKQAIDHFNELKKLKKI